MAHRRNFNQLLSRLLSYRASYATEQKRTVMTSVSPQHPPQFGGYLRTGNAHP